MPEPILGDSFEWVAHVQGPTLRCRPLAGIAPHVFTTRSHPSLPHDTGGGGAWALVATLLAVVPTRIVHLTQVHGARVVSVPADAAGPRATGTWADADAAVTGDPDVALAVKVADCVPILLADRRSGVVAAVHAGWRGTAAGAAAAAVAALAGRHGALASDLVAALGPSIGPCCYEVGTDVADGFIEGGAAPHELAEWFSVEPRPAQHPGMGLGARARSYGRAARAGKLWLDTWRANADQLAAAGVSQERIYVAGLCTACYPELFHSYRVDGPKAGRLIAAIRSAGVASAG